MEPPLKRIRISKDDITEHQSTSSLVDTAKPLNAPANNDERPFLRPTPTPTRTINPNTFRRQFLPNNRIKPIRRSPSNVLSPRAPDATVTTSVIDVAVNDGSAVTQIAVPTANTAIDVPNMGTLTIPGVGSIISGATQSLLPSGLSTNLLPSVGSLLPSSGVNNTSSSSQERTTTVTATSTFHVSYTNGTFIEPSTTQDSTAFATAASTTDDSSSNNASATGPVFGEGVTYTSSPTANYNGVGLSGASSSTLSSATPLHTKNPDSGPVLTQQQAQVVGGVVGSVAGVALVLVILLYFLRWYRQRLKSQGRLPEQLSSSHNLSDPNHPPPDPLMSHSRQSLMLASPFAQSLKRWRTHSEYTVTTNTTSTTAADSEKGFQKIAGRKIPSVLSAGGDGFGGNFGAFEKDAPSSPSSGNRGEHSLSRSSFYRDSGGFYSSKCRPSSVSEPGTPSLTSFIDPNSGRIQKMPSFSTFGTNTTSRDFAAHPPPLANMNSIAAAFAANSSKPEGFAMMRSSPARTPVTQSPSSTHYRMPVHAPLTMDEDVPEMPLTPPPMTGLGLRPSTERHDSHVSARSASSPGKFKENI